MHFEKTFNMNGNVKQVYKCLFDDELKKIWMKGLEKVEHLGDGKCYIYIKEGNKVGKYYGDTLEVVENEFLKLSFETVEGNSFKGIVSYKLIAKSEHESALKYTFEGKMEAKNKFTTCIVNSIGKFVSILILNAQMKRLSKLASVQK